MDKRGLDHRLVIDAAIQLDLIAKVRGVSSAEIFFLRRNRMREKAESLIDEMRDKGHVTHALPFNVMMTLDLYEHQGDLLIKRERVFEQMRSDRSMDRIYNLLHKTKGEGSTQTAKIIGPGHTLLLTLELSREHIFKELKLTVENHREKGYAQERAFVQKYNGSIMKFATRHKKIVVITLYQVSNKPSTKAMQGLWPGMRLKRLQTASVIAAPGLNIEA
ncbi:unnamed protein product [Dovyalis caffra]|uniref:Uncharacterized protein n=1 Tax=Dovyalis caffra TaxID=77055 RepID=A0AAV1SN73_9ROSI|nr:unnamed protein product [Dovyalis caffra]